MEELVINQGLVNEQTAKELVKICPFSAIGYENGKLSINSACKMCKLCAKKGPAGVVTVKQVEEAPTVDKSEWVGVTVYADQTNGKLHNVTLELLGKARELAKVIDHPVYALLIGHNVDEAAQVLLSYGADKVFVYDDEYLADFNVVTYTNVFEDFINKFKPSSVLMGATNLGRSLAPRIAARFRTGLTADCTVLEMKENTDLVQIRPAFGGNIMAQIINPDNRPQFCTVRYKVFSAPQKVEEIKGEVVNCKVESTWQDLSTVIEKITEKSKDIDISESDVLVAVGRGFKSKENIETAKELARLLGGNIACSRPLVEENIVDAKYQIGLSGKTVKPKLIITLGISGAVQFAAGMKNSECIVAINTDKSASIFDVAHYCVVGDVNKIVPQIIEKIKEAK